MQKLKVYSSQNILVLSVLFMMNFSLLYLIGSHLVERKKINEEIEAIRIQNEKDEEKEIIKKRQLEYLKTPQRIDKEAKMQMGKIQEGEKILVLIEEKLDILPPINSEKTQQIASQSIPPLERWKWILFR